MREGKSNASIWVGVVFSVTLITLAWGGYPSVGFHLLMATLPMCS
jgi:hypothetical protein